MNRRRAFDFVLVTALLTVLLSGGILLGRASVHPRTVVKVVRAKLTPLSVASARVAALAYAENDAMNNGYLVQTESAETPKQRADGTVGVKVRVVLDGYTAPYIVAVSLRRGWQGYDLVLVRHHRKK